MFRDGEEGIKKRIISDKYLIRNIFVTPKHDPAGVPNETNAAHENLKRGTGMLARASHEGKG
jgi:hypothetical protein